MIFPSDLKLIHAYERKNELFELHMEIIFGYHYREWE